MSSSKSPPSRFVSFQFRFTSRANEPRREKGSPRGKPIPLEPNPPSPPLLVAHPLRGNRFNRLASVVHLIVSSPGVTNRNPEEGGGEEKSEKYPRRNGKRSGRRRGWKKFDGYIGEGKLDFRFADNSPRLRSRRIGDESCIPPVREYASTDWEPGSDNDRAPWWSLLSWLDGDDDDRGCKRKREEALREKSRRVKLQATGEIDFRDIAGSFDVAGAVSCIECVRVGGWVRARVHQLWILHSDISAVPTVHANASKRC